MRKLLTIFAILTAMQTLGCSALDEGELTSNLPPEASLTGGPLDGQNDAFYRVHFYWSGHDPDGSIVGYEYLITDDEHTGPLIIDEDIAETLAALAYEWTYTEAHEGRFVMSADQYPDLDEPADSIYWQPDPIRFHGQHTIFLRAVDNEGAKSALPAHRTFTATTLAPSATIIYPADTGAPGGFDAVSADLLFRWVGGDSLQDGTVGMPDSSRFHFVEYDQDDENPVQGSLLSIPDSLWTKWEAPNDSESGGWQARIVTLQVPLREEFYSLLFVQAKDEAGAVTSHYLDGKNLRKFRFVAGLAPYLILDSPLFGPRILYQDETLNFVAAEGSQLNISWRGDASRYGNEVDAYRFGWDIQDPDNDEEWSHWSASATSCGVSYGPGLHRLRIQCRDISGGIREAQLAVDFVPITLSRDLLFVDDYDNSSSEDYAQGWPHGPQDTWGTFPHHDDDMKSWWDGILSLYGGYDPVVDFRRVTLVSDDLPLSLLGEYKRVIWEVKADIPGNCALGRSAGFHIRHAGIHSPQDHVSTWLEAGGQLLLCGNRPIRALLPWSPEVYGEERPYQEPVAFLRDQRVGYGFEEQLEELIKNFLPWRWFGIDASALPANPTPTDLPGVGEDWPTPRGLWGMIAAGFGGESLIEFGNANAWSPDDSLRFRPEIYEWQLALGEIFAPTDPEHHGFDEVEIYNWDWLADATLPPLDYREDQYFPFLSFLPTDSTTRWGNSPAEEHSYTTPSGAPYCETCYSTGGDARHAIGVIGLREPTAPSVLLGFSPYFLAEQEAQGLLRHLLTDVMGLD